MTKRDKLRQKLRNNPKGVKFSQVETLLLRFGFTLMRVTGSHHVFGYGEGARARNIVIPVHGNAVRANYVKDTLDLIDELFPEDSDSEQEQIEDEQDD